MIAAGGTAGHVVPALAVAEALRAEGAEVHFIGGGRAEAQLVPAAGFPLHTITVEGLSRTHPLRAARALLRAAAALPRAHRLLARLAPDAVMGGGGYVAGPVGVAALSMRIPLVLTEADSHLGLTNRALAPFARRVCLAFALPGRDGARYRLTGRPVPDAGADRASARRRLGIGAEETCVLVFGGSLGARSINLAALEAFSGAPFHVLHVCGRRDYPELAGRVPVSGYDLREYMELEEFAAALAAADLVVARSGGSVFEMAAHALPAILIPYPRAAGDHQRANAGWMADAGAAVVLSDAELSAPRLGGEVAALLGDPRRLAAMAAAAGRIARPHAAREVAEELLGAARR
ncbi:MAG TPA: UDP-N-acetylglucosamine--N-acetylmuramyl-(pentapeptide) pyrophosphoryl-undecaprenol N-acetylglucosamine transferase [Solirubrobacteraceae bacterium]|nr:UDP-N-acetylglucosamine--N-acetylmuramyl-(pentapeptide) pyrophosphoryl-undecaprenol N-acetylglucosamine transferase [Solirubrobacteraceae bacterium]